MMTTPPVPKPERVNARVSELKAENDALMLELKLVKLPSVAVLARKAEVKMLWLWLDALESEWLA